MNDKKRIERLEAEIKALDERISLLETMSGLESPPIPVFASPVYDHSAQPICHCGESTVCPIHGVTSGVVASG